MHKLNLVYLPPAAEELLLLEIAVLDSGGKHIEYEERKNAQWRKVNTLNKMWKKCTVEKNVYNSNQCNCEYSRDGFFQIAILDSGVNTVEHTSPL